MIKQIQHTLIEAQDAAYSGLEIRPRNPIMCQLFNEVVDGTSVALQLIEDGLNEDARNVIVELTHNTDDMANTPGVKSVVKRIPRYDCAKDKTLHYLWEAAYYAK